tara:strand:- start:1019 stop:1759 length:741 start_codon:yes stop_codon:yes gene_type:complete
MSIARYMQMAAAGVVDGGVDTTISLLASSAPTGTTYTSAGTTPRSDFTLADGFRTAGNASGFAYPLSGTDALDPADGDWLIQTSVLVTNRCSDPSIAVWAASTGRSSPQWAWGTNSSRVSTQMNCNAYLGLWGQSVSDTGAGSLGSSYYHSGAIVTLHFWYSPSITRIRARVSDAANDWDISGTLLGTRTSVITETIGSGTAPVYWGLSSDFDGVSPSSVSTNFKQVRIRSMPDGYNNPGNVPTAP